jgi:DNA-binding GntR family transcriptional regulator
MEEALRTNDLNAWAEADDDFHTHLLELHGNARMSGFVSALMDQAHRARMVTLRMRAKPVQSTEDHRVFLQQIRAGDAKAVRASFRKHRKRAAKELLGLLEEYGLSQL